MRLQLVGSTYQHERWCYVKVVSQAWLCELKKKKRPTKDSVYFKQLFFIWNSDKSNIVNANNILNVQVSGGCSDGCMCGVIPDLWGRESLPVTLAQPAQIKISGQVVALYLQATCNGKHETQQEQFQWESQLVSAAWRWPAVLLQLQHCQCEHVHIQPHRAVESESCLFVCYPFSTELTLWLSWYQEQEWM